MLSDVLSPGENAGAFFAAQELTSLIASHKTLFIP
jgi:hypothetical protein